MSSISACVTSNRNDRAKIESECTCCVRNSRVSAGSENEMLATLSNTSAECNFERLMAHCARINVHQHEKQKVFSRRRPRIADHRTSSEVRTA